VMAAFAAASAPSPVDGPAADVPKKN